MIAPYNACKADVAVVGNHDLDFGITQMAKCFAKTTTAEFKPIGVEDDLEEVGVNVEPHPCRWLLSNLHEKGKHEYGLGGFQKTTVIERGGKRIGFIGIIEKDLLVTFKNLELPVEYTNLQMFSINLHSKDEE